MLTKGPHVTCRLVDRVIEYFGRDEVRRATNIARFRLLVVHGEAKITKLGNSNMVEQYIAQFQIAMNDALVVDVL